MADELKIREVERASRRATRSAERAARAAAALKVLVGDDKDLAAVASAATTKGEDRRRERPAPSERQPKVKAKKK